MKISNKQKLMMMMNRSFKSNDHVDENDKKKKKVTFNSTTTSTTDFISSGVFFDIDEDLITEFLIRLPPISLLRFKSVSKTWYSLISKPDFLRRNTSHQFLLRSRRHINQWHVDLFEDRSPSSSSSSHPRILLKRRDYVGDPKMLIFPPMHDHECVDYDQHVLLPLLLRSNLIHYCPPLIPRPDQHVSLLDSCNGLLLYIERNDNRIKYWSTGTWYVCNPITHDYMQLPTFDQEEEHESKKRFYLPANIVFDPLISLTYKVVLWIQYERLRLHGGGGGYNNNNLLLPDYYYRLYVYSSETRSWKLSVSRNSYPVFGQFNPDVKGVLYNGALYWTTVVGSVDASVCYDVEKEKVGVLKFPKMPVGYLLRRLFYFGECGGRLRLIENYYKRGERNGFPVSFDILEMKHQEQLDVQDFGDEDELWIRIHRVDFKEADPYYGIIRSHALFHIHILHHYKMRTRMKKEEEEEVLLIKLGDKIILFNLASNTFGKELRNGTKNLTTNGLFCFTDVLNYTITLFPPSGLVKESACSGSIYN